MPTYIATDYEPVAPGLYTAKLDSIEQAQSQHGTYYPWVFVIGEGPFKGRKVRANVSDKFGPQSKARRWCEQMIGRPIKKGEEFNTDVLLGKSYRIVVTNTTEDEHGRVYDNVDDVRRLRPDSSLVPGNRDEKPEGEEDFDYIA